jgi:hypothetical protein
MKLMPILTFLPEEAILLIMIFGGIAIMFNAKRIAKALFTVAGLMIILPFLLEPFLEMLPEWALYLIMIFFVLSIPLMIMRMVMGQKIYENFMGDFMGTLAANAVTALFLLPITCAGWVSRTFRR